MNRKLKIGDHVRASKIMPKDMKIPIGTKGKIIGLNNDRQYPYKIKFINCLIADFSRKEFTLLKYEPLKEVEWLDKIQENFREGV